MFKRNAICKYGSSFNQSRHFKFRGKTLIYIVKPKATCQITRQASTNARASVRYPI